MTARVSKTHPFDFEAAPSARPRRSFYKKTFANMLQILEGSLSAISKPIFCKYILVFVLQHFDISLQEYLAEFSETICRCSLYYFSVRNNRTERSYGKI